MDFAEFQLTGLHIADLGPALSDSDLDGCPGRLYVGDLLIEDTTAWPPEAPGHGQGRWYGRIEDREYQSDDLAAIERRLYDYAVAEGIAERNAFAVHRGFRLSAWRQGGGGWHGFAKGHGAVILPGVFETSGAVMDDLRRRIDLGYERAKGIFRETSS